MLVPGEPALGAEQRGEQGAGAVSVGEPGPVDEELVARIEGAVGEAPLAEGVVGKALDDGAGLVAGGDDRSQVVDMPIVAPGDAGTRRLCTIAVDRASSIDDCSGLLLRASRLPTPDSRLPCP